MKTIIIQGIKYDEKSSFQKGPGLAPPLIREVLHCGSSNYYAENGINIESSLIEDKGDFEIKEYFEIEKITRQHLDLSGKILTLGGDHSITFPIIKAYHRKYPVLDIFQIDAIGEFLSLEIFRMNPDDEYLFVITAVENSNAAAFRQAFCGPPQKIVVQLLR